MKKIGLAACLALASGVADAGSIEIPINGGVGRLHIDEKCTDRLCGTASWTDGDTGQTFEFVLPNVSWKDLETLGVMGQPGGTTRRKAEKSGNSKKTAVAPPRPGPAAQSAPAAQSTEPPPAGASNAAAAEGPANPAVPPASATTPSTESAAASPPSATPAAPGIPAVAAPAEPKPPAPEQKLAAVPPSVSAPASAPVTTPPAAGPIGLWMTENQEGMVRVEPCGRAICGYEVNARTQQNGRKVLIDMTPAGKGWKGRIHDPRGGGTYESTVSMKGRDTMRVEGCAFGGMFCGGQIWTRVN